MSQKTNIDLILPCHNPPLGWEKKVIEKFKWIKSFFEPINFHLFVVNDGSMYGFEAGAVAGLKEAVPEVTIIEYSSNRGKGYALREAVRHCTSNFIIYTDYDFPYTDESFQNVVESLLNEADIVVAVRDRDYQRSLPLFRKFLSESSHLCNTFFLRLKINDTQGGLKGFNQVGKSIFLSTKVNRFLFDTEFIYKAQRKKVNIQTVQSRIRDGITLSNMGFNTLKQEIAGFFSILFNK